MKLKTSGKAARILIFLLSLLFCTVSVYARDDTWIKIQTPRFSILSQHSERKTKKWAKDFDKFVTALHTLFKTDDKNLLPLTIVLFKDRKAFSPYRVPTESDQAKKIVGIFANRDSWSIIGLPGLSNSNDTRGVLFHEAVHWYIHSNNFKPPLWLEEGFAEFFSTFEVIKDKGKWGMPIQAYVEYLNLRKMQTTRQFLSTTQDETLQNESTYYPQAWAMVHYLMLGNNGKNMEKFKLLISEMKKSSTEKAFQTAFDMTYSEFDEVLLSYIRGGRYTAGLIYLKDTNTEMEVEQASDDMVQFALGRLAIAAGLFDLGIKHAEKVIAARPSRPEGYELMAMASASPEDRVRMIEALDKAISLGSRDSYIYLTRAVLLQDEKWKKGFNIDETLDKDSARKIADMYIKAIWLHTTDKYAYEGYVNALMNLDEYKEDDRELLEQARSFYPEEGSILAGLAILDKMDGDIASFNKRVAEALDESINLPLNYKKSLPYIQQKFLHEWLFERIQPMLFKSKFEEAKAFLDEQKALPYTSTDSINEIFKIMYLMIDITRRLNEADTLMKASNYYEAEIILKDIQKEKRLPEPIRNAIKNVLFQIEQRKIYGGSSVKGHVLK